MSFDRGTGSVEVVFDKPFRKPPTVTVSSMVNTFYIATVADSPAPTERGFRINIYNSSSGAAVDQAVSFIAVEND